VATGACADGSGTPHSSMAHEVAVALTTSWAPASDGHPRRAAEAAAAAVAVDARRRG
jgi:hypothetical protein